MAQGGRQEVGGGRAVAAVVQQAGSEWSRLAGRHPVRPMCRQSHMSVG